MLRLCVCGGVALTRDVFRAAVNCVLSLRRAPLASFAVRRAITPDAPCGLRCPRYGLWIPEYGPVPGLQTTWTTGLDYGAWAWALDYGPWAMVPGRPGLGLRIPEFQTWNLDPGPKLQTTKAAGWLPRLA
jgi:hypothetical protein